MPDWVPGLLQRAGLLTRAARAVGWTYLAAALTLTVLLAVPLVLTLFGYRAYVIYGGSMGSALHNGSVAITHRVSADSVEVGDIVAVRKSSRSLPVLHRVIDIQTTAGSRQFVTQGDANKEPDPQPVSLQGSGDKVVFGIPLLGYVVHFARSPAGRDLLLFIPATLLVVVVLWQTWKDVSKQPHFGEEPQC